MLSPGAVYTKRTVRSEGSQGVCALDGTSIGDVVPKSEAGAPASVVLGYAKTLEHCFSALILWSQLRMCRAMWKP